jgi:saccharopine dehydrogenase (NAD+, L-lysine forming)
VSDVSCDVTSECNALPIYSATTSWQRPVRSLRDGARPLDIIAIDNLPSLLPAEASTDFSAQLVPLLMTLGSGAPAWRRCERAFGRACRSAGIEPATGAELET